MGSLSPFTYKVDLWLRMTGVPYEEITKTTAELIAEAPRGLIPYVEFEGEIIDDSSIIIDLLKERYNDPMNDKRLSREQQIQGGLIKSLCEYELNALMAYGRFAHKDSDYKTLASFNLGDTVSEEQRDQAIEEFRALVLNMLHVWRIGRRDSEFIDKQLRKCLGYLSDILGTRHWLFDDVPCVHDIELCAMVTSLVHYPFRNPQVEISREYTNLVEYCDRIRNTYYDLSSIRAAEKSLSAFLM